MNNEIFKEKQEYLLESVDNYEAGTEEAATAVKNLKSLSEIEIEFEKMEIERKKIESDDKKSKRDLVGKIISVLAGLGLAGLFVYTDETKNSIHKGSDFCKRMIKF